MLAVLSGSFILPDQSFSHIQMASVTFRLLINGKFLYSAVSIPPDCSKHFTFYSLADLFNQTTGPLNFSGKHPTTLQLMHKDYSYINIHLCL